MHCVHLFATKDTLKLLMGGGGGGGGCFLSARMGAISLKACEMFSSSIKKMVRFDQVHR